MDLQETYQLPLGNLCAFLLCEFIIYDLYILLYLFVSPFQNPSEKKIRELVFLLIMDSKP